MCEQYFRTRGVLCVPWASCALGAFLVLTWIIVFLLNPRLYPEGGYEGNSPWRDEVVPGIRLVGDTPRYIRGAENMLSGHRLEGKQSSYLGYILLVAACLGSGLGIPGVVAVQVFLGILALPCLFWLTSRLAGRWCGAFAVLLYAANPEVAVWHTIIQTDSVYFSSVLILLAFYVWAWPRGVWWRLAMIPTCLCVALIRPNGWILLPTLAIHGTVRQAGWGTWTKTATTAGIVALTLMTAFGTRALRKGIETESPRHMLVAGEVLWGNEAWRVTMPDPGSDTLSWPGAAQYVLRHPIACIKLAFARIAVLLVRIRPGYSLRHNAFLLIIYPLLYVFTAIGAWRYGGSFTGSALLAIIAGHVLIVALTFAHQDGRFFLYFFPELLALAVAGMWSLGHRALPWSSSALRSMRRNTI